MLEKLAQYFTDNANQKNKAGNEQPLVLATAALFLEMAYADFEIAPEEKALLRRILKERFALGDQQIEELLLRAGRDRQQSLDIWKFTSLLKEHLSREEKLQILENLWQIIFADSRVDKYEEALIRKITNLIGLEHSDMIQTKLKVKNEFHNIQS